MLVLVLLIVIPLLTYSTADVSGTFGTSIAHQMAKTNPNVSLEENVKY